VITAPPNSRNTRPDRFSPRQWFAVFSPAQWLAVAALVAALTAMRVIYACVIDLRTDEA
jgi:hypothetical protein